MLDRILMPHTSQIKAAWLPLEFFHGRETLYFFLASSLLHQERTWRITGIPFWAGRIILLVFGRLKFLNIVNLEFLRDLSEFLEDQLIFRLFIILTRTLQELIQNRKKVLTNMALIILLYPIELPFASIMEHLRKPIEWSTELVNILFPNLNNFAWSGCANTLKAMVILSKEVVSEILLSNQLTLTYCCQCIIKSEFFFISDGGV